jgi:hypothetical protein
MPKTGKSAKSLTDDWIKQVVTGQRHKLAHMADGGEVPEYMRGLSDEQLRASGVERTAPETPAAPAPEAPLAINSIPGDPGSTVDQLRSNWKKIDEASGYKNGGCVKRMEKGGDVDGPGTGTSDSVPAMLSDGEYVLPADTVDAVGKATLDKLKNATHTPVHKPAMRGMVSHLVNGGGAGDQNFTDQQWALARQFYPKTDNPAVSIENARRDDPVALQQAAGKLNMPQTPLQQAGPLQFLNPFRVVSTPAAAPTTPTTPATPAPAPVAEPAPVVAPAPASPAPAAANPITAPGMVQRPDLISESERLVNTPGLGLAGLGLAKRVASGAGGERSAEISGQYGLQNTAMTANERLEQAKLVEHQRQQNLETWTPDKNMMGELMGYGRTKGGTPQYVTKESLMAKPTLAQFLAKARPVNPKATDAELTAHYNATYAPQ